MTNYERTLQANPQYWSTIISGIGCTTINSDSPESRGYSLPYVTVVGEINEGKHQLKKYKYIR